MPYKSKPRRGNKLSTKDTKRIFKDVLKPPKPRKPKKK